MKFVKAVAFSVSALLLTTQATAQQNLFPPLDLSNFTESPPQGFGDRQNSWTWSMEWFNGKLYVGTARSEQCVTSAAQKLVNPNAVYPPADPDMFCEPDPNDLPLRAEIWAWDPGTNLWTRVYQSPEDVPIPNTTKFVARDIGYRGMLVFTEQDGTQALYVGGCSSNVIHPGVPPARMLRTTDGTNFQPIPQDPGTFLPSLGNTCFRGIESFNNKMYAVAANWKGQGVVVESANPSLGNNAFRQVTATVPQVYEISPYNGYLWATFVNDTGFSVGRTSATGNPPYQFNIIIDKGGYRPTAPNTIALSLQVFQNSLVVGGDGVRKGGYNKQGAELFRINADDSWDLIAGVSRTSTPNGPKPSLSGLGIGFGWQFNNHMWRIQDFDNILYVGTFDQSTPTRLSPKANAALLAELGFDLWYTLDGEYYTLVDRNGFGDKFNMGVRSLFATPYGLWPGSANPYYGLRVYQGIPSAAPPAASGAAGVQPGATAASPPEHVQVESRNSTVLLSWDPPAQGAKKYRVFRWTLDAIDSDEPASANGAPVVGRGSYQEVGVTDRAYFADLTASPRLQYGYQVFSEDASGTRSRASNFVTYPAAAPALTFPDVWTFVRQLEQNGKFSSTAARQQIFSRLAQAQQRAASGQFDQLNSLRQFVQTDGAKILPVHSAHHLQLMLSRMSKRAQLVEGGLVGAGALHSKVLAQ